MNSKRISFICLAIAILSIGFTVVVQAGDGDGMGGRGCNPAGLWFGFPLGQPPFKVVSIVPVHEGRQRYVLAAEDQDPSQTPFRGEMVRIGEGHFRLWGIQYFAMGAENYGYQVVSGEWNMSDCNTAEGDYLVSLYRTDPFHNEGAVPFFSKQILNRYERVPQVDDSSDF